MVGIPSEQNNNQIVTSKNAKAEISKLRSKKFNVHYIECAGIVSLLQSLKPYLLNADPSAKRQNRTPPASD